eukprot:2773240-Prymnesium_polylepis.1
MSKFEKRLARKQKKLGVKEKQLFERYLPPGSVESRVIDKALGAATKYEVRVGGFEASFDMLRMAWQYNRVKLNTDDSEVMRAACHTRGSSTIHSRDNCQLLSASPSEPCLSTVCLSAPVPARKGASAGAEGGHRRQLARRSPGLDVSAAPPRQDASRMRAGGAGMHGERQQSTRGAGCCADDDGYHRRASERAGHVHQPGPGSARAHARVPIHEANLTRAGDHPTDQGVAGARGRLCRHRVGGGDGCCRQLLQPRSLRRRSG